MLSKHISGSCQQNPLYRDGLKQTCTSASLIEEYYHHLPHFIFPLTLKISTRPISMPLVGKGRIPQQESRGGEQEPPSPHGRGVCLVHGFPPPPPPSGSARQRKSKCIRKRGPGARLVNRMPQHKGRGRISPPLLLLCEVPSSREQLR